MNGFAVQPYTNMLQIIGSLPLPNDGLLADNIRHTVVEVRDKVPILVIDGAGRDGRKEGKDSFILERSLAYGAPIFSTLLQARCHCNHCLPPLLGLKKDKSSRTCSRSM